ncbi:hypothetical protein EDB83DRAFT_2310357 [Lactarius deliciosus]|nr:hypothetical protein EDB83DRAFT_2310357 [Lactarius deliciosus]
MDSHDVEKTVEVVTSAEVVPDLGKKDSTTDETISVCFTIAAAAFGLISDGWSQMCNHLAAVHWLVGIVRARDIVYVLASFACYRGVGGEYPAASTSTSEVANEQMLIKRGPALGAARVVFVMVTIFVFTFGGPLASSIPHRPFNRRRESPFHGLAYLLWVWDSPSLNSTGPPVENAQLQASSKGRYQEWAQFVYLFAAADINGLINHRKGSISTSFQVFFGGRSLVQVVHGMINCRA